MDKKFGFTEGYYIYDSLLSLVLHYNTHSLKDHNKELDTRLLYPVGSDMGAGQNEQPQADYLHMHNT